MHTGNNSDLEIVQTGTLHVPFSQGSFAQLLLWLKEGRQDECPIDLSSLPESTSPFDGNLENGETFFIFREIKIRENEDTHEIVLIYDRMRVEDGGVEAGEDVEVGPSQNVVEDQNDLIDRVASRIYDDHQIVISKDLLRKLRQKNPVLKKTETEEGFISVLDELGLFPSSSQYADQLGTEVHLGEDE